MRGMRCEEDEADNNDEDDDEHRDITKFEYC